MITFKVIDGPHIGYLDHIYANNNGTETLWHEKPVFIKRPVSSRDYNTTCKRCGSPAYLGLNQIECPVCHG
jgi:hypothetical protein